MQEINELKNLVIQSLEGNGVLGQIRAQIRSSVFKIIEMQENTTKKNAGFFWENPLAQTIYNHKEGLVALELIHEFLEFFKMDYTLSVFTHESNLKEVSKKDEIAKKLGLNKPDTSKPILISMINSIMNGEIGNNKAIDNKENLKMPESKSTNSIQSKKEETKVQPVGNTSANTSLNSNNNTSFKSSNIVTNLGEKDFDKKGDNANKGKNLISFGDNTKDDQKTTNKKNDIFEIDNSKKNKYQSMSSDSDISISGDKEKKKLAEVTQKMKQMEQSIKTNNIGELPTKSKDNSKDKKQEPEEDEYEDEEFEENVEEELFEGDDIDEDLFFKQDKNEKKLLASSEDVIAQSQSQGFDVSVDSLALEEYDYYEDADKIK